MKIEFSTDNAAFEDDLVGEVGIIADRIVARLRGGITSGIVHDSNGKRIGEWSL